MLLAVGHGGVHRIAERPRDAVGKPPLEPHVNRDRGKKKKKDRHKDLRHQRHDGEDAGQPQVQPRARRLRPARGHDARHLAQDKCRHDQDVDHVGQDDQPQARRIRQVGQGAEHEGTSEAREQGPTAQGRAWPRCADSDRPWHARPGRAVRRPACPRDRPRPAPQLVRGSHGHVAHRPRDCLRFYINFRRRVHADIEISYPFFSRYCGFDAQQIGHIWAWLPPVASSAISDQGTSPLRAGYRLFKTRGAAAPRHAGRSSA